jgi:hypothetical protein
MDHREIRNKIELFKEHESEARQIYFKNRTPNALNETDRISDLNYLKSLESSFILFSPSKNGTTSLFKTLSKEDYELFYDGNGAIDLSSKLKNISLIEKKGLLIDEGNFSIVGGLKGELDLDQLLDLYIEASKHKKIGIRLHPPVQVYDMSFDSDFRGDSRISRVKNYVKKKHKKIGIRLHPPVQVYDMSFDSDFRVDSKISRVKNYVKKEHVQKLIDNGFIFYYMFNISYEEFNQGIKQRYGSFANTIPDQIIKDAVREYGFIKGSMHYVNESFALFQIEPKAKFEPDEMRKHLTIKYTVDFNRINLMP